MDKDQAFETLISLVYQFKLGRAEWKAVDEAVETIAKEIGYKPRQEETEYVEDLEESSKKANKR